VQGGASLNWNPWKESCCALGFFWFGLFVLRAKRNFKAYTCLGASLPIFVVLQPQLLTAFSFLSFPFFFFLEGRVVCLFFYSISLFPIVMYDTHTLNKGN